MLSSIRRASARLWSSSSWAPALYAPALWPSYARNSAPCEHEALGPDTHPISRDLRWGMTFSWMDCYSIQAPGDVGQLPLQGHACGGYPVLCHSGSSGPHTATRAPGGPAERGETPGRRHLARKRPTAASPHGHTRIDRLEDWAALRAIDFLEYNPLKKYRSVKCNVKGVLCSESWGL